ncbi:eCIS core domain-containing protein [Wenjunlia tyrosinilytica]|uniref:NodB homology domain-containing protein n=1 Tax=Wenjunlia tyrosinilytica TaxID=1544741 RepID=A0A917ZTI3_9ACTN|nr:DUF4157 domain-containing protein [Wenjunlia tyrosinilytica]GGO94438.1 hypothetical protein GCM10012280_49280 [Wenjunlia tyrosinilytica]
MRAYSRISRASAGTPDRARAVGRRPDALPVGNQAALRHIARRAGQEGLPAEATTALRGPGRPLDPGTRLLMEQRFGRSFRQIRVHTGAAAASAARAVDAQAFTVGSDIVFGTGRYLPATPHGRGLLAHELAHVAQQEHSPATGPVPGDVGAAEHQADSMAHSAALAQPVPAPMRAPQQVMRASRTFSLTFDDGPHTAALGTGENRTENILDTLKGRGIKAGFFVQTGVKDRMAHSVGQALVARMQAEGHSVGIHTGGTRDHESHPVAEAAGRLEGELRAGKAAIKKATGSEPTLVRPPYGASNKAVRATYARVGLTNLLWDIDADVNAKSLADLKKNVAKDMADVHKRGWKSWTASKNIVVLLHDLRANTAKHVGDVIDHIKDLVNKASGGKDSATFTAP